MRRPHLRDRSSRALWLMFRLPEIRAKSPQPSNKSDRPYKLHLGERSNDLKRLPTASCRQCQTSALSFGGYLPALWFDSLLLVCRRGDDEIILALAFCQCRSSTFLTVSRLADCVSAFVAGTVISATAPAL